MHNGMCVWIKRCLCLSACPLYAADALSVNRSLTSLSLRNNTLGQPACAAIGHALVESSVVHVCVVCACIYERIWIMDSAVPVLCMRSVDFIGISLLTLLCSVYRLICVTLDVTRICGPFLENYLKRTRHFSR